MDIISSIFVGIFIALLIGAAFIFGATLLMIILIAGGLLAAMIIVREWWMRWRFEHYAKEREKRGTSVIEGEFEEVPPRDERT